MDGVALHFANTDAAELEVAARDLIAARAAKIGHQFVFRSYPEWGAEADESELAALIDRLGGRPTTSYMVECRYGQSARNALEFVVSLMSRYPDSVLDDDFGHMWRPTDIKSHLEASKTNDLYSLRDSNG